MDCEKAKRLLMEYIDGELEGALRDELEGHLRSCHGCNEAKEMLLASSVAPFRNAQRLKAPEHLWRAIREAIEGRTPRRSVLDGALERFLAPLRARRPALALATAVAILLAAITFLPSLTERPATLATYMEEQAEFFIYLADENGGSSVADLTTIGTDIEEYLL